MIASTGLILNPGDRTTPEYLAHLKEAVNANINPVKYLSIDPGKSNGICGYDAKCYTMFMLTIQADDMTMFLHQFDNVKVCVVEDFKLYPGKMKSQIYSDMETSRVIGRIETWAETHEVELVKQLAAVKPNAYAWIGEKALPKSNKKNHVMDAHAHFMYYAITRQLIPPNSFMKKPS